MKYFLYILLSLYAFYVKSDLYLCENSPVTLNIKQDWENYKITDWNNCIGELFQNYDNKKKWQGIFRKGLPNGYGTVKYEGWKGYYEGFLLEGKMHGEGKYINSNGKIFYGNCINNKCKNWKENKARYKRINIEEKLNLPQRNLLYSKNKNKEKIISKNREYLEKELGQVSFTNKIITNNNFSKIGLLQTHNIPIKSKINTFFAKPSYNKSIKYYK